MKRLFYWMLFAVAESTGAFSQNVGIGIDNPVAGLHLVNNNGFIAAGRLRNGKSTAFSDTGSVLIWNPYKGAFRAGNVSLKTYWSDSATGFYSVALGNDVVASASGSVAIGQASTASQVNATAIGYSCEASGFNSVAISGAGAFARAQFSTAIGYATNANSYGSLALGKMVTAGLAPDAGQNAVAFGIGSTPGFAAPAHYAVGNRSFAIGNDDRSVGERAFAIGNDCIAGADFYAPSLGRYSFAIGNSCTASGIYSFALGNNANTNNRTASMVLGSRIDGVGVYSPGDYHFLAQFAGGYQLQSNTAGTLGVYLQPNSSAWQSLSDSNRKEQTLPMDDQEILEKVSAINYYSWKYKDDPDAANRHYGIMAQDFYNAFGKDALGTIGSDTLVNPIDLLGVAYSAIKALKKENDVLRNRVEQLEKTYGKQH